MKKDNVATIVYILSAAVLLLHLAVNIFGPYGFHRDEFLYIAMGAHLRLFAMDFPPLIAIIADFTRAVLGNSIVAIRFFPALAAAFLVWLSADIARRLGGGRFAQLLAALLVFFSPIFLRPGNLFQPVIFDQLWWTLGCWAIVRWKESDNPRWWIALGIIMGIGLFTKFSIFLFGFGVLVGLLAPADRKLLTTRWPWIALGLTLFIGSPAIIGQITLGFPFFGVMHDLQRQQFSHVSWLDFVTGQVFMLGFISFIVAVTGLVALFAKERFRSFRILAWVYAGAFLVLFLMHGKAYYLGPIYPAMLAAGSVMAELVGKGRWKIGFRAALLVILVAGGIFFLPIGVPILAPQKMSDYTSALGLSAANTSNSGRVLRLPQDYADMLGWNQRVETVARVYRSLAADQRKEAVILASNYGEAGAIDFLGPKYGLPHSICFEGSYWFYGPGKNTGATTIAIGFDSTDLVKNWRQVTPVARIENKWTVPEEQDLTIYLCGDEIRTAQEIWPSLAGKF
jgi:4-amino-4-deoxy-L-arabinose transferase-like glycosyltransferase